ncbi:helix-turn-helix domain-containing protein [Granulicatella adiacens]|uniref:helix-turn-helix domain-containing protein n=1 Tax=Granulicatella adiacens TaxID=46124 RepID=UPI0021DAC7CF|nr:helix-turn-helix transcriptional regulator [Granulicatella adiacens]UXY42364.1 helix-turn-helix domain-containing protein [Granulicatella adiacens]
MFGMSFANKIKDIRLKYNLNQEEFANRINNYSNLKRSRTNFNKTNVSKWENGKVEPRMDTVRLIASTFEVSPNYLIDMSDEPYFNPNNTEGKDIQKDLQKMIEQLENGLYSKETAEYSEETRELIISSLEHAIKIARMEAKKKFTPNKYKKG